MMKKLALLSIGSVFLIGLLGGFAGAADLAKDQVLSIAFDAGDLKSLDPHRAAATADRAIVDMMFNGLVRYPSATAPLTAGARRETSRAKVSPPSLEASNGW